MTEDMRVVGWIVQRVLYAAWVALMILIPLFGFWLASSLAAYEDASQWIALLVGLLLFPIVPVGWDLLFVWRRARRKAIDKLILTRLDRLVVRTVLVNGLFVGVMIWRAPHTAFRALAVRGDWILDGRGGPAADAVRGFLLGIADRFEQRWHRATDHYGSSDKPPPEPAPEPVPPPTPFVVNPIKPVDPNGWPLPAVADPIVTDIPDDAQTSIDAVGKYFAARITDPRKLAKALHDYIVLRLHYDVATLRTILEKTPGELPSQEAEAVFAARTGVCEGYARLYVALGKAAGLEVAYITGYIRDAERRVDESGTDDTIKAALEGIGHAWNAVKIDGAWLLVDTTWDDPVTKSGEQKLESTYLFTPPRVFAYDHFPEESAWQLVDKPISVGDFVRQPMLSPYVGALGVVLEEPMRSQVTVDGELEIVLENPFGATLDVSVGNADECRHLQDGMKLTFTCSIPAGPHEVRLFGAPGAHATELRSFGSILVNGR